MTGLLLALSSPGTASAAPVVNVECGSSRSGVAPGTAIQLTLLGIPLGLPTIVGAPGTQTITQPINALLGTLCSAVVTVVAPVVSAVPTAVTDPVQSAVAPIVSAVPPVVVPVPGGGSVTVGVPRTTAPGTSDAPGPTTGASGGTGGSGDGGAGSATPTSAAPGSSSTPPRATSGTVQGAPGSGLLPTAAAPGTSTGTTGTGTTGARPFAALGLSPSSGSRPAVFGSPVLAGFSSPGSAAQFGGLGTIPTAAAGTGSSVQALDSQLGTRPGLVIFAAVLALAATAGCVVRQWVLRAVPSLATGEPVAAVVPVTKGSHRR